MVSAGEQFFSAKANPPACRFLNLHKNWSYYVVGTLKIL